MCETETKFSVPAATWTRTRVSEVELERKPEFGGRGGAWGSKNQTWNQIFGSISTCGTETGTETVLNYFYDWNLRFFIKVKNYRTLVGMLLTIVVLDVGQE